MFHMKFYVNGNLPFQANYPKSMQSSVSVRYFTFSFFFVFVFFMMKPHENHRILNHKMEFLEVNFMFNKMLHVPIFFFYFFKLYFSFCLVLSMWYKNIHAHIPKMMNSIQSKLKKKKVKYEIDSDDNDRIKLLIVWLKCSINKIKKKSTTEEKAFIFLNVRL